ncbi:nucleotidyltransferase domain-containing protein [Candidatus Pyrohabitans sp.]
MEKILLKGDRETIKKIKRIILEAAAKHGVEVDRIILFGSRARGDFKEESDWDVLVVTKKELDRNTRKKLWLEIIRKLPVYADLIIVNKELYDNKSKYVGNIAYESKIEGIII